MEEEKVGPCLDLLFRSCLLQSGLHTTDFDFLFSACVPSLGSRPGWNPHECGVHGEAAAVNHPHEVPRKSHIGAANHGVLAAHMVASTFLLRRSSLSAMVFRLRGRSPPMSPCSSAINCMAAPGPSSSRDSHSRS